MTNAKYKTQHPHKKLIEEYLNDTSTEFEYLSYACDGSPRKWGDCFATSIINDVGNHSSFRVKEKQLKVRGLFGIMRLTCVKWFMSISTKRI
jgi:hypothetical protein